MANVSQHPLYRVHRQMLQRCYLLTAPNYPWYGAKGVTVCDRWRFGDGRQIGFRCFLQDMGERPHGMTLDRIDPFKPYEPGNCRWASWAQQGINKREHYLPPAVRAALCKERRKPYIGEKHPTAKLKDAQVAIIKRRIAEGARTSVLARDFNVAPQTISGIKRGDKWVHIQPEASAA